MKTQVEGLTLRSHQIRCSYTQQSVLLTARPRGDRPPAIQLSNLIQISSRNYYRLSVSSARDHIGEGRRHVPLTQHRFDLLQRITRKRLAVISHDHHIRNVVAKLGLQLGLHIDIKI